MRRPIVDEGELRKAILAAAPTVSRQRIVMTTHKPEPYCLAQQCFSNVDKKVAVSKGWKKLGWSIHLRFVEAMGSAPYIYFTHHAVWLSPAQRYIDITPYVEKHRPIELDGSMPFLLDDTAFPVGARSLPMRFFPVGNSQELIAYVAELNEKEQKAAGSGS